MVVLVFFVWLGFCALVAWLTAFQMPDGYGNVIVSVQFFGALISGGFIVTGAPTAIDPSTKVVVSGPGGGPNREVTWPRKKGVRYVIIGASVFVVFNIGGWIADVAMGLPARYVFKVKLSVDQWVAGAEPTLAPCLATAWNAKPETCTLRYRVTTPRGAARLDLVKASCPTPAIEACVVRHLAGGALTVQPRLRDSIAFSDAVDVWVYLTSVSGTGPPPPVEKP
jgi:hypothetical protein